MADPTISQKRSLRNDLTAEFVRSAIDYCPETGIFRWKHRKDRTPAWNARWAGKIAGSPGSEGYINIGFDHKLYRAHRLAWLYVYGSWPGDTQEIDHVNMCTGDNRIANLRLATTSENCSNRGRRSDNTSGFRGVSFHRAHGKWQAYVCKDQKQIYLGYFDSLDAARTAREAAVLSVHGAFARKD